MKNLDSERVSMIKVRGGYSDTKTINPYSNGIQVEEFDDRTRNILNNKLFYLSETCFKSIDTRYGYKELGALVNDFCRTIVCDVFGEKNISKYEYISDVKDIYEKKISMVICNAVYNEVLDIIWFVCNWMSENFNCKNTIFEAMNHIFEQESVGYRFVNKQIIQITDPVEIQEIEQAATIKFEGCRNHIDNALEHLSDRDKKDYKNSIKESISAVESICKVIAGDEHATLGDALKVLEKKKSMNPVLKTALTKLYSYTNDQGGVRHSEGLFVSNVTFEEAKFMLVSCSAFVNYLISEYGKIEG